MEWTVAQAKRDFQNGFFTDCRVLRFPMADGWLVQFSAGANIGALVDAHDKQPRQFKTLDAAIRAVESIGWPVAALLVENAASARK